MNVNKKILGHLSLYEEDKTKRKRASPASPDFVERIIEPYDSGWADYEGRVTPARHHNHDEGQIRRH